MSGRPLALFDFDGTLTHGDSLLPFLRFALSPPALAWGAFRSLPKLGAYALKLIDNETAKQDLLKHTLGGHHIDELRATGARFAEVVIPKLLRDDSMARLREHQSAGHRCVLVSASVDLYLDPWTESIGFDDLICSRPELTADGNLTGKLTDGNCYGEEKVRRIRTLLDSIDTPSEIHAYGDSGGDRPMLALADHAYWVTKAGIEAA